MTKRDYMDCIRALVYSYYTTITGWGGVLLRCIAHIGWPFLVTCITLCVSSHAYLKLHWRFKDYPQPDEHDSPRRGSTQITAL